MSVVVVRLQNSKPDNESEGQTVRLMQVLKCGAKDFAGVVKWSPITLCRVNTGRDNYKQGEWD